MERSISQYERAVNDDIVAIPALWVDIDIADSAHAAQNLPPDYESARGLLPGSLDPTMIIHSGHGIHAYYQLREMMETRTADERTQADDLLRRLQGIVRANAASHGWHVDSVPDLCRVLRVPGTYNHKNNQQTTSCVVTEYDENKFYNVDDFDILPPVEAKNDSGRREKFDRRETDGPASYMMENCVFLQFWMQNFKTLPEPVWKAACTNIIRGVGGEQVIVDAAKSWLGEKFNESQTMKRLHHYLNDCTPQTCQYIHTELNFSGCEECTGIKSPCSWSLGRMPQALARIRKITLPDSDNTLNHETLGDLALLKKYNSLEYAKFEEKCRGRVNLNNMRHEVKVAQASAAGLTVVDGGGGGQEDMQNPGSLMTTCQTVPDTPINLKVPASFRFLPSGVYKIKSTQEGNVIPELASGTPMIISCRTYNLDNGTEKVQLSFKSYNRWVSRMCKRSEVFASRNIVGLADIGLNISSETAKYAVKYLQEFENINQDDIPLSYSVSKIGWREKSISEFIIPSRSEYSVDIDDDGEITEAFEMAGDYAEWISTAREVRKHPFARFVLSASFAAPLLKIFSNRNFMIFFWGTSGGGKTASQIFSLSVWGRPSKMMKSFYGTTNGIERAAEYSNDFPLVINEKQVMSGSNKQENLESLVYMLEGGHGKQRASKSGIRKTATWRTIAMGSGEEPLSKDSSIQGVKTRLLEINAFPVLPDDLAKRIYGMTEINHGNAGPDFINRLLQESNSQYHEIIKARDELIAKLTGEYPDYFSVHIDNIATVCIADYLASMWIFGESSDDSQQGAYDLAVSVMEKMPTHQDISDTARAWNFVETWIISNYQRFGIGDDGAKLAPEYGYIRDGYYNVYPVYITNALDAEGFSSTKLLREFADSGLIDSSMEGGRRRFKVRVSRSGRKIRVIRIRQFDLDNQNNIQNL